MQEQESSLTFVVVAAILIASFVIGLGIYMVRWQNRRADGRLNEWASRHNYRIVSKEVANPIGTGPMQRSGNKQVMYRVTLADAKGEQRTALIKLGSETTGMLSDDVNVEWQ